MKIERGIYNNNNDNKNVCKPFCVEKIAGKNKMLIMPISTHRIIPTKQAEFTKNNGHVSPIVYSFA